MALNLAPLYYYVPEGNLFLEPILLLLACHYSVWYGLFRTSEGNDFKVALEVEIIGQFPMNIARR